MQFRKLGVTVTAVQMVGAIYQNGQRYPAFSWVVRGWYDDEHQVVMSPVEFKRAFVPKKT